jgi:hypothetical protein
MIQAENKKRSDIFHDVPESIDYEMTSKHSPDVIKEKIEIA